MVKIPEFKLERYFAEYEFTAKYLLSSSDCESLKLQELLKMADNKTINLWNDLRLGYTETMGHPLLKNKISELYINSNSDDVLTAVPEEGIFISFYSMLNKDDEVIVIHPAYQSLYSIPQLIGCNVKFWKFRYNKQWYLDIKELKKILTNKTKMIIVNFPHNPTGFIPDNNFIDELISLADKYGIYIFSDEMYRFLEFNRKFTSLYELYNKSIVLSGLSKSFGLPGLRSGWIITKDKNVLETIKMMKDLTTICSSAPSEILSIIALDNKENIVKKNIDIVKNNLNVFKEFIDYISDFFEYYQPDGSSVGFFKYIGKGTAKNFCNKVLKKLSIMMVYGELFDFYDNFIRIGFGKKDFSEIMDILKKNIYSIGL